MKKRRLLSIVISLCMVLALMPQMVFAETYVNEGIIKEGTFTNDVENQGTIDGGIFNGKVKNASGLINNGTFNDSVVNDGTINGGTFSGSGNVRNSSWGTIYDGKFDVIVYNKSNGKISGGIFNAYVENVTAYVYDGTFYGTVNNVTSHIHGGTFYGTVNNVTSHIHGGTFYGTVDNETGDISGGTFYGTVDNEDGDISGGTFYGGISGHGRVEGTCHTVSFDLNGGSGAVPIQYFVGIDTAKALKPATDPTREGYEFVGWYNGYTEYDFNQPVTDNVNLKALWALPELIIKGLEDGKTYCDTVQFEVYNIYGSRVIVKENGVILTADANGKYSLEKGSGKVDIYAKDDTGNENSVTVTVNNGHTWSNGVCSVCDYVCNHTGGTEIRGAKDATCTEEGYTGDTYCKGCGAILTQGSSKNKLKHDLVKTPAKEATAAETGNDEYWQCTVCDKYFSDADGTKEITDLESWKADEGQIDKLTPEIIEGMDQSVTEGEKKALSFTSNAAFDDFKRVGLDGSELSEEYYEKAEGSIIITLDADYVATLPVGEHTIGIVSESGIAETTFTVAEKAATGTTDDSDNDNDSKADAEDSAKTGDEANLALWLALLLLSGAGITGVTAYTRRKRTNE